MGTVTGIEIGPDFCVLVAVRGRRGRPTEVRAFQTIERAEWPSQDGAVVAALESVRRRLKLPRRARVVAWDLPEGGLASDPLAKATLRPLTAAGFRIETVLSPVQALVRVAVSRPREEPAAWLALNVHGAAIAIVRGQELLFERTFSWTYNTELTATRAQLLQRYSLVAQLAPELRRGLSDVRDFNNVIVGTVITCGDLPELRSLTMPLIEELDLEVETLDSTEGLAAVGQARLDRFAESVPALRLACAAGTAEPPSAGMLAGAGLRAAAAALIVAAVAAGAVVFINGRARVPPPASAVHGPAGAATSAPRTATSPHPVSPAAGTAASEVGTPELAAPMPEATTGRPLPTPAPSSSGVAVPGVALKPPPPAAPPATTTVTPSLPSPASAVTAGRPPSPSPSPVAPVPVPQSKAPSLAPPAPVVTAGRPSSPPPSVATVPVPSARGPSLAPPVPPAVSAGDSAVRSVVPPAAGRRPAPPAPAQPPMKEPLPRLDSVLVDQNRRLAIIDGGVVGVGDRVGSRVVVAISRDGIVLREPSGLEVRVPLRLTLGPRDKGGGV